MLIDISFGVFGIIPLLIVHRLIRKLERLDSLDHDAARAKGR